MMKASGRVFVRLGSGAFFTVGCQRLSWHAAGLSVGHASAFHTSDGQQLRSFLCVTAARLAPEATSPSSSSPSTGGGNATGSAESGTALDVAMRVNKLKRLHQTGGGPSGKRQIELDAWTDLNSLTEEQINSAEGKAVSLLLNSWAYFAKFWEKGAEGPGGTSSSSPVDGGTSEGETSSTASPAPPQQQATSTPTT
ncbi:hypothetical protein TRVL_06606 [Trypanosoma vivax]|nr:hypothetical protein TRVL_06606 [Trypanosoma vivax]